MGHADQATVARGCRMRSLSGVAIPDAASRHLDCGPTLTAGRHERLFARITSFGNVLAAARVASRGKRYRRSAAQFLLRMEHECLRLAESLSAGSWHPAAYRVFAVCDPKPRTICAAPFGDRVVHQALVQCVEPIFERGFIHDSYSCRVGKGTHAALWRVAAWAREFPWVLKVDVQKYFPSIDHGVVVGLLERKVSCRRTLDLFARILASWQSAEAPLRWFPGDDLFDPVRRARGLPIGNLTSQFLSNVVLDVVDHRVKDGLRVRAYARYCDDMVVFGRSVAELREVEAEIRCSLDRIRLSAHPTKTRIGPTIQGVRWVGYRVWPNRVELPAESLRRLRRRLVGMTRAAIDADWRTPCLAALRGHAQHGMSTRMWDAMAADATPPQGA